MSKGFKKQKQQSCSTQIFMNITQSVFGGEEIILCATPFFCPKPQISCGLFLPYEQKNVDEVFRGRPIAINGEAQSGLEVKNDAMVFDVLDPSVVVGGGDDDHNSIDDD